MKDNNNLTSDAFWVRTLFMIAFWFVYRGAATARKVRRLEQELALAGGKPGDDGWRA